jgi:hypothetical protein
VGRANQVSSFGGGDPDPDHGTRLDLSQPPQVEMAAPLTPTGFEAHSEITADRPAAARAGDSVRPCSRDATACAGGNATTRRGTGSVPARRSR